MVCSQSARGRSAAATSETHGEYWLTGDDKTAAVKAVIQTGCAEGDVMPRVEGY